MRRVYVDLLLALGLVGFQEGIASSFDSFVSGYLLSRSMLLIPIHRCLPACLACPIPPGSRLFDYLDVVYFSAYPSEAARK